MTNESCHSEPRHDRGEESLLLNDEILRPEEIGTQDDFLANVIAGLTRNLFSTIITPLTGLFPSPC